MLRSGFAAINSGAQLQEVEAALRCEPLPGESETGKGQATAVPASRFNGVYEGLVGLAFFS